MPPRLPEDVVPIARALLEGNHVAADTLLKAWDARQWCPIGSEVLGDRSRLAGQAAALLVALRRHHPASACRLFLLVAAGGAGGLAAQHHVPLFDALQQLADKHDAGTGHHINRSDASFHRATAAAAQPVPATVASCGAETMTVRFEPELQTPQGGRRHQVQVVLKRTEYSVGFRAPWHTLQQPVCFTVQPDGGSCLLEQQLPLDGGRRLVEAEFGGQTFVVKSNSRTEIALPARANAAAGQRGSITRFCMLDTAGTHVMLFRLEKLQRVFSDGQVDEVVGAPELGQLLDGLGITEEQLGIGQAQPLLPLPQQAPLLQQAQQVQQQMAGAGSMQAAGLPHTGAGLMPGLGGGLHMPPPPLGVPVDPALHPAAQLAAQQAALLASASQYAMAAAAPAMLPPGSMPLPLGSMPSAVGSPQQLLATGAAGGLPAPAQQPAAAAAAGVPWAAGAGVPEIAVPAVEPAAASQPAGTAGRAGGSSGGGSAGTGHSSSDIANLQEAQSATEDAQQLLSEDVDRLSIKVEGHDEQLSGLHTHFSELRRDVDSMRVQLGGTVEPFAAAAEEEEEVSSQPGKRRRSHAAAAAAGGPSAATTAPGPAGAAPAPAAVPAAAPQPAASPIHGTVLPPDAEVRRLLLDELLDPAEGRDKLQLCRALKDRLQLRISGVGDLTRVVNRVLTRLLEEHPPPVEKLPPRQGESKPLWKRAS